MGGGREEGEEEREREGGGGRERLDRQSLVQGQGLGTRARYILV